MQYLFVSGMSGAGKSSAARALEDIGYYCIDNMPAALISKFVALHSQTGGAEKNVAFIVDVRGESGFDALLAEINSLKNDGYECKILVLDCSHSVLVNRYKETRRIHPLAALHGIPISEALFRERQLLQKIFEVADYKIDTTYLKASQTKARLQSLFSAPSDRPMVINVISFGFKNGIVPEADLVFDVRFLPNPFYEDDLRVLNGLDAPVYDFVHEKPETKTFLAKLFDMLNFLIPLYIDEGKSQLMIGIGCTGGKHRSVAIAEALAKFLEERGENVVVIHRDMLNGIG